MISQGSGNKTDQPIFSRLWGSGFLPTQHQGVRFRSGDDPVLYLSNPPGHRPRHAPADARRRRPAQPDGRAGVRRPRDQHPDRPVRDGLPHADLRARADRPLRTSRSTSSTCTASTTRGDRRRLRPQLPARPPDGRARRAVRPAHAPRLGPARQPAAARSAASARTSTSPPPRWSRTSSSAGLLDDTLVIWGGEFGRTVYSQGALTKDNYGRDHHGRCFTMWLAGGGIKPGIMLRRDRRLLLQHRRGPRPHPRLQRHDPALPGHRPHPADLPLPGPRLPPDRRARERGEGPAGLTPRRRSPNWFPARTGLPPSKSISHHLLALHRAAVLVGQLGDDLGVSTSITSPVEG